MALCVFVWACMSLCQVNDALEATVDVTGVLPEVTVATSMAIVASDAGTAWQVRAVLAVPSVLNAPGAVYETRLASRFPSVRP